MEMQQSRRLHNDGRTENTRRPNEKRAQTGDESIEERCCSVLARSAALVSRRPMHDARRWAEFGRRGYEAGATLITAHRPTQDWGAFLGDVPAATAILDRFLAHATIVQMAGKSYR